MKYSSFGTTGLNMPVLTCGGMRFQQSWEQLTWKDIEKDKQKNVENSIIKAFEAGINHFETARGYGTSELQMGKALSSLPRDKIIIQTKVNPKDDPKEFEKDLEKSMDLLNPGWLDMMAIHGINDQHSLDISIKPGGCVDVVKKWQEKGYIKHIGFASHAEADILIKAIETGLFSYINLHYFYIKQSNIAAIKKAAENNMGVLIISPNDKGGKLYEPSKKLCKLTAPLSPMAFNDLFLLKNLNIHTISIGIRKPEDFDEHLSAIEKLENAEEIIPLIEEKLNKEMKAQLGKDWTGRWDEGLPSIKETTNEISIKTILWLHNLAKAFDLIEYAKMRYNLRGNGGHWFPGNKAEDIDKYDLSECLKNSPFKDKIPGTLKEAHEMLKGEEVKRLQKDE